MLIEAFACGVPVVASDSGEIPHVVADAGVIVAEADGPAWSSALADLLESPGRRAELRAGASSGPGPSTPGRSSPAATSTSSPS